MPGGEELIFETGKIARQADGSVLVKVGKMMLLATVVSKREAADHSDFLPLFVDYQEKFSGSGKIPGSFFRRESRLSDYEVLICRLVDRAIRPMFPKNYFCETQVNIMLISADMNNLPDAYAAFAASTALMLSDIPFNGPISEVRVVKKGSDFLINPTLDVIRESELDIIVAGTKDNVTMVEGEAKEIPEDILIEAIKMGHNEIVKQCAGQQEFIKEVGAVTKRSYPDVQVHDETLEKSIQKFAEKPMKEISAASINDKMERRRRFDKVSEDFTSSLPQGTETSKNLIRKYMDAVEKEQMRKFLLKENVRVDGRKSDEIRPIECEVNFLPSAHGSSLFTRGETQSLVSVTLGSKVSEQMVDGAILSGYNRLMLHYNFPGFSTGEVKPNRGPARREIGHGNLAMRALKPLIPVDNPYTIRIVSDILESNGSSSMATVCGGSMSLMDAGISMAKPVAGIAMGLVMEGSDHIILSDILGDEDHIGDMDFKIAGTEDGITACQMDIKVDGLSYEILAKALEQAKTGRLSILEKMKEAIAEPRQDQKPNAPRFKVMTIEKSRIGMLIGPGGKVIQEIQRETGASIVVEEDSSNGIVNIFATSETILENALSWIKKIVAVPEVGEVYEGKVKTITNFGAFVEFTPGREGLLHISEIKWERVNNVSDELAVDQTVSVKLLEADTRTGKYKLSRKVLLEKPSWYKDQR